jgi:RNA polymerase sigma factor (sigma-70 family)
VTTHLRQILDQVRFADSALTDGQLLAQFVAMRDEPAFAAIVQRHGPMVLGVCRRVLRHEQDAEDAFQATFLVLARKASSVLKRESLGCWLYQVAHRTALAAAAVCRRSRVRERPMNEMPHPEVAPAEPQDWRPLLDRELSRLPARYRAAVILCDLEGLSRKQAARQLGIVEGTLSSRLATARKMLARRLADSGFLLSGSLLVVALAADQASAQMRHPSSDARRERRRWSRLVNWRRSRRRPLYS